MARKDEEDTRALRSRRAVLGGAVAAGAAGIASTLLATASPAGASEPDGTPLIVGQVNQATSSTELDNTTGPCFNLSSTSGTVLQCFDQSGTSGVAVSGYSPDGTSVSGTSFGGGTGVWGSSTSGVGTVGQSNSSYGVSGTTGYPDPTQVGGAGVIGMDQSNAGSVGVLGTSQNGVGVNGTSNAGHGVYGQTSGDGFSAVYADDQSTGGGYGVSAYSDTGVALLANAGTTSATALQVAGRSVFSTAGVATVASGKKSVTVPVDTAAASSAVIATLQQLQGDLHVLAATAHAGSITITLSAAASAARKVAYFVIG